MEAAANTYTKEEEAADGVIQGPILLAIVGDVRAHQGGDLTHQGGAPTLQGGALTLLEDAHFHQEGGRTQGIKWRTQ